MSADIRPSARQAALALLQRDLRLAWRRRSDAIQPVLFALLVVTLFALAQGREPKALSAVAGAVLWLSVLLSAQLAMDRLFRDDAADGSLEQWLLAPVPLPWLCLVRVAGHWLVSSLPLVLLSPLLALMLHLPHDQLGLLLASLALGTPLLSLIGGMVAALTVGLGRAGILVALLSLPLYVPVLVFGAGALAAAGNGQDSSGALLMLAAMLAAGLLLAPWLTAAALRTSLE
ncbi:MAG: heme exporter protein CcmB [Stenotrophomonas sp.]